jgi:hypothetical protein
MRMCRLVIEYTTQYIQTAVRLFGTKLNTNTPFSLFTIYPFWILERHAAKKLVEEKNIFNDLYSPGTL